VGKKANFVARTAGIVCYKYRATFLKLLRKIFRGLLFLRKDADFQNFFQKYLLEEFGKTFQVPKKIMRKNVRLVDV